MPHGDPAGSALADKLETTDFAGEMETRFLPSPAETARLSTEGLRNSFLVRHLFDPGELRMVYTSLDRMIIGGVVPRSPIRLGANSALGTAYFTERREVGVINLGEPGIVRAGEDTYELGRLDSLYIGAGQPDVCFEPAGSGLPRFYIASCPAHRHLPTAKVERNAAESQEIGDSAGASRRRIHRVIHPAGVPSCQLVMGFTELEPGSVWNTMPPHTHGRRSEIYLYFDLGANVVVHLMGEPSETRHLVVRDCEAVLSPPWSMHCGAGTSRYSFVWAMAGENMEFTDMDPVELSGLF